jgi:hypothetical protein
MAGQPKFAASLRVCPHNNLTENMYYLCLFFRFTLRRCTHRSPAQESRLYRASHATIVRGSVGSGRGYRYT